MNLGNLARVVISAGAISLFTAQYAKAQEPQDLETRVRQSQKIALKQPPQPEITDFRAFFSGLYEKINKFEFDFEQSTESGSSSDQIGRLVFDDIMKLSGVYGISLNPTELRVFTLTDSIGVDYKTENIGGSIEFYKNGKTVLWGILWENSSHSTFRSLFPTENVEDLDELVESSTGIIYNGTPTGSAPEEFDFWSIYREIRKLSKELNYLEQFAAGATSLANKYNNYKTYGKAKFVGSKLARIGEFLSSRYGVYVSPYRIRAAANRILINDLVFDGVTKEPEGNTLIIFSDGRATFTEVNDKVTTVREIFPVEKSNR